MAVVEYWNRNTGGCGISVLAVVFKTQVDAKQSYLNRHVLNKELEWMSSGGPF